MNSIKFIYFDIGGVMLDSSQYFKTATKKFGIPLDEFIKLWLGDNSADEMTRGKISSEDFWKQAIKKFKINSAENFNFIESWISDYHPRKEVHELAKKLSKKYKIGLLSNIYNGMMPRLIKLGIVADIKYSTIVLSNETGLRKPEKEIYKLATNLAGVKVGEILLVDDRKDFVKAAQDYGWQTFWFDEKNVNGSIKQIEKLLA